MQKKRVVLSFILLSVGFIVSLLFTQSTPTDEHKAANEFKEYYRIYSLKQPDKLWFAGEPVPMQEWEIAERYDREMLTNVYWQSQTILLIKRANRFFPIIEPILKQHGIPDDFKYLAVAESGLQNVTSPAGANGYWQFLDKTGQRYGLEITEEVDERLHLEKATHAACAYFKEAYRELQNWALVAASYNMGIEGIKKQLQQQQVNSYYDLYLNSETSRYVLRAIALKRIIQHPQSFGFYLPKSHLYQPIQSKSITIETSITDLAIFAKSLGVSYKMLKVFNPWLRKNTLTVTASKSYKLAIPLDTLKAADYVNELKEDSLELILTDSLNKTYR
ncbi:MAG: lytic transglycosylase domain-containing protein [Bacteroidia bacterium]|nr:lytic transglycosylase domain-containing protein [Bacteroidia bacterium]